MPSCQVCLDLGGRHTTSGKSIASDTPAGSLGRFPCVVCGQLSWLLTQALFTASRVTWDRQWSNLLLRLLARNGLATFSRDLLFLPGWYKWAGPPPPSPPALQILLILAPINYKMAQIRLRECISDSTEK